MILLLIVLVLVLVLLSIDGYNGATGKLKYPMYVGGREMVRLTPATDSSVWLWECFEMPTYHAPCKAEYRPLDRLNSQLTSL